MSKVCETLRSYGNRLLEDVKQIQAWDSETSPLDSRAASLLGILAALLVEGQSYSLGSQGL